MQVGGAQPSGRVEMTAAGWVVALAILGGLAYGGTVAWQHNFARQDHFEADAGPAMRVLVPDTPAVRSPAGSGGTRVVQSSLPSAAQLADQLLRERRDRAIQASAWRAVAETTRQQIAEIEGGLQDLDARVDAIQKTAIAPAEPTRPVHAPRDVAAQAAAASKSLHQELGATRAAVGVDISSLPVESDSAQALNVTGFGNGVVEIGGHGLAVGQEYQKGETVVAIDAGSHSIVTSRRIINVTN